MLCIVCSRPLPIPIYQDENKLCKSCASQIKLKDNLMRDLCTDADLESAQRQLIQDLNLEDDLEYEQELNYLREAKKHLLLNKSLETRNHTAESLNEYVHNQFEKKARTDTLTKPCVPESANFEKREEHVEKSFSKFNFNDRQSITNEQKPQQACGCGQLMKEKANRRVAINRGAKYSILTLQRPDEISTELPDKPLSIACRAIFRPTHAQEEPGPQFEKIRSVPRSTSGKCESIPLVGNKNPFICPVTFCKNIIPVSDLIKHFKLNHIRVPIVSAVPDACTNLLWEVKTDQFGTAQCLMLLLSTVKHKEAGDGHVKDCLPIAIMTTKVRLSDLAEVDCHEESHFHLIWLTAMSSSVEPVYYTITAWDGNGNVHIVNTTQSYSIRSDQNPKMVYRSGMVMMLTPEQISRLSNKSQDMVKLQIVVH
ncbi:uncharacterized protein LOC119073543 isoform X2 [Bradysia coprophila]|uniref:uncharacterized protein LOC119073543 isoform X2 n=1 Tax=Bradysia coprophila TaxID=38358 RepID=UPI00187DD6C8|nr:uncharacterized protein LOC119073543 isoform X2 [Bradysia coprophila]